MGNDLSIEEKRRILIQLIEGKVFGKNQTEFSKILFIGTGEVINQFQNRNQKDIKRIANIAYKLWDVAKDKFSYTDDDLLECVKDDQLNKELSLILKGNICKEDKKLIANIVYKLWDVVKDKFRYTDDDLLRWVEDVQLYDELNHIIKEIEDQKNKIVICQFLDKNGKYANRVGSLTKKIWDSIKSKIDCQDGDLENWGNALQLFDELNRLVLNGEIEKENNRSQFYKYRMDILRTFVFKDYEMRKKYLADMGLIEKLGDTTETIQIMLYSLYVYNYFENNEGMDVTNYVLSDCFSYLPTPEETKDIVYESFTSNKCFNPWILYMCYMWCGHQGRNVADYLQSQESMQLSPDLNKLYSKVKNGLSSKFQQIEYPTTIFDNLIESLWTDFNNPGSVYIEMRGNSTVGIIIGILQNIKGISFDFYYWGIVNPYKHIIVLVKAFNSSHRCKYNVNYQPEKKRLTLKPINENSLNLPLEWRRVESTNLNDKKIIANFKQVQKTIENKNKRCEYYSVKIERIENKQEVVEVKDKNSTLQKIVNNMNVYLSLEDAFYEFQGESKITKYKFNVTSGKLLDLKCDDKINYLYIEGKYQFEIERLFMLIPEENMEKINEDKEENKI